MTKYITSSEAADKLGVTRETIWRWINKGYFEGVRRKGPGLTSPNLIPEASVDKLAKELGVEPLK